MENQTFEVGTDNNVREIESEAAVLLKGIPFSGTSLFCLQRLVSRYSVFSMP